MAAATGARFIRVNQWANAYVANEGIIEGQAAHASRYRSRIGAHPIKVFADVHVKHGAHAIVADRTLAEQTEDAEFFDADVLIATGSRTGDAAALDEIAGIKASDTVVKVGGTDVKTFDELVAAVRKAGGPTPFVVQRNENGQVREFTTVVDVERTERWVKKDDTSATTIGAIGVAPAEFGPTHYNPLSAVPATFAFTGDLAVEIGKSLVKIPTKVGALVHSIGGTAG